MNGAEAKLQRKVRKLKRILARLTEVEGANNIVSRQGCSNCCEKRQGRSTGRVR